MYIDTIDDLRYNKCRKDSLNLIQKEGMVNMSIAKTNFGTVDGRQAYLYTLENSAGTEVGLTDFGATLVSISVADRRGKFDDVVVGFDDAAGYANGTSYQGATTGRVANRISNAQFTLNGVTYNLAKNHNSKHHLHGGNVGYNKRFWEVDGHSDNEIVFSLTDADGTENYPGTLTVKVTFTLTEGNELIINYRATTDKDTIINLTNHSYFNLTGQDNGNIYDHELMMNASKYTASDNDLIPTGEIKSVSGTMLDFTSPRKFGDGLTNVAPETDYTGGYDHNFILDGDDIAAQVYEPTSGRVMTVRTDASDLQLYTGNFLDSSEVGKGGKAIAKRAGFCLETQLTPNSINMTGFPSIVLKVAEEYNTTTSFTFTAK